MAYNKRPEEEYSSLNELLSEVNTERLRFLSVLREANIAPTFATATVTNIQEAEELSIAVSAYYRDSYRKQTSFPQKKLRQLEQVADRFAEIHVEKLEDIKEQIAGEKEKKPS